jgi:hypothetical protein
MDGETTLDSIDADIAEAVAARHAAFERMMVKDSDFNRAAYHASSERLDSLLEMRHGWLRGQDSEVGSSGAGGR